MHSITHQSRRTREHEEDLLNGVFKGTAVRYPLDGYNYEEVSDA